jgi:hypothetical protein
MGSWTASCHDVNHCSHAVLYPCDIEHLVYVRGFFGTVLERLGNEPLRDHLGAILDRKLNLNV